MRRSYYILIALGVASTIIAKQANAQWWLLGSLAGSAAAGVTILCQGERLKHCKKPVQRQPSGSETRPKSVMPPMRTQSMSDREYKRLQDEYLKEIEKMKVFEGSAIKSAAQVKEQILEDQRKKRIFEENRLTADRAREFVQNAGLIPPGAGNNCAPSTQATLIQIARLNQLKDYRNVNRDMDVIDTAPIRQIKTHVGDGFQLIEKTLNEKGEVIKSTRIAKQERMDILIQNDTNDIAAELTKAQEDRIGKDGASNLFMEQTLNQNLVAAGLPGRFVESNYANPEQLASQLSLQEGKALGARVNAPILWREYTKFAEAHGVDSKTAQYNLELIKKNSEGIGSWSSDTHHVAVLDTIKDPVTGKVKGVWIADNALPAIEDLGKRLDLRVRGAVYPVSIDAFEQSIKNPSLSNLMLGAKLYQYIP